MKELKRMQEIRKEEKGWKNGKKKEGMKRKKNTGKKGGNYRRQEGREDGRMGVKGMEEWEEEIISDTDKKSLLELYHLKREMI